MIFKRKLYNDMLQWKHESGGQTALLIKGARRVGKSTLARTFAEGDISHTLPLISQAVGKRFGIYLKTYQILTIYSCGYR